MSNKFWLLLGLVFSQGIFAQGATPQYFSQGWSSAERQWFYTTTQGSQLLRYDWFLALERPDSQTLFLDDNLARFGYLAGETQPAGTPKSLPVGFVADKGKMGWFVGMTCAACHTSEIKFGATTIRVDGAPTNADMYGLIEELGRALTKAATNDLAFARFSARLPKHHAKQPKLRENLTKFAEEFAQFVADSTPVSPWGPGRLDAFGMILNRLTNKHLGHSANNRVPNAPVSYPFLWGTGNHDVTQWNGSAPNKLELHRLARNAGEVLGVFADFSFAKKTLPYSHYESSVNRLNLLLLDRLVNTLKPPAWPESLYPINKASAERGRDIYAANCAGCHNGKVGSDGKLVLKLIPLADIKTDVSMAIAFDERMATTKLLEGQDRYFVPSFDKFAASDFAKDILLNAVVGAIVAPSKRVSPSLFNGFGLLVDPVSLVESALEITLIVDASREAGVDFFSGDPLQNLSKLFTTAKQPAYKARPLEGIWATAPYLHNGAVPNLTELLKPPGARVPKFSVGSREFDPVNVGFVSSPGSSAFELDTAKAGNSNSGHEYGTALTPGEKADLIEYMKTL